MKKINRISGANSPLIQIHKNFLPAQSARALRHEFLQVFSDPRRSHPKRFLWDHWFIENQYRMHRTPARDFFSDKKFEILCNALVRYGQEQLGCHSISQPWLSYYVDGDFQSLHTDAPHGPWAYVYSLTDWERRAFTGGETLIQKPETLNYWLNYSRTSGLEHNNFFNSVPARFNQLTVFDPRLPHGVAPVRGTYEPTQGRLVVHGWFVNPEPFVTGALAKHNLKPLIHAINISWSDILKNSYRDKNLLGTLILRLIVLASGKIAKVHVLTNTLVDIQTSEIATRLPKLLAARSRELLLPRAKGSSELTLPLIFD